MKEHPAGLGEQTPLQLWSLQSEAAYEELLSQGVLRTNTAYVDPCFVRAYQWMASQLEKKTPRPTKGCSGYPVWAWSQFGGAEGKKPRLEDLALLSGGARGVLLELRVQSDRCLLSDFQKWHAVLNDEYLPHNFEEQSAFEAWVLELRDRQGGGDEAEIRRRIEESWPRVFDLEAAGSDCWEGPEEREIQAVLWEIEREMVVAVEGLDS